MVKKTLYIDVEKATLSDIDEEEFNDKVIRLSFDVCEESGRVTLRQSRVDALARIFVAMLTDSFVLLPHEDAYAVKPNSAFSHDHFDFFEIADDDGSKILKPANVFAPLCRTLHHSFAVWKTLLTVSTRETNPEKYALFDKAVEAVQQLSVDDDSDDENLQDKFEEYLEHQDDADMRDFSTQSSKLIRFGGDDNDLRDFVVLMQNNSLLTSVSLYRPVCTSAVFRSVVAACGNILHLNLDMTLIPKDAMEDYDKALQDCIACVAQFLSAPSCNLVSFTLNFPKTTFCLLDELADAIGGNRKVKSLVLRNVIFDRHNYDTLLGALLRNFTLTKTIVVPSLLRLPPLPLPPLPPPRCLSAIATELAFRNAHDLLPKNIHRRLLDFCTLFLSMHKQVEWPPYVLLEIFDWFPPSRNISGVPCCTIMQQVDHAKKIAWINQICATVKKLRFGTEMNKK